MNVESLWRYPVKSMQGEQLDEADVGESGVVGDRQWALVDVDTGLALTARRQPELLFAAGRLIGPDHVEIELPDGTITTDDTLLSSWLGRRVELRRAGGGPGTYEIAADFEDEDGSEWLRWDGPADTFHDSAKTRISLASTATMGSWDVRRFRSNVVVTADAPGEEDALIGRTVAIGTAVLDVVKPVGRCVMTTRPQPNGIERDLDVLRTINSTRDGTLAVAMRVATPGTIHVGDGVRS